MTSNVKKQQKYEAPLKIEGKMEDVLKASFKGVPEKLKDEQEKKKKRKSNNK